MPHLKHQIKYRGFPLQEVKVFKGEKLVTIVKRRPFFMYQWLSPVHLVSTPLLVRYNKRKYNMYNDEIYI